MRIASRFQRSGRSNDRRARALATGVWVWLISFGCFFELEPLEEPGGGIGGAGTAGALAGEAGESPVGGDGGGGVAGMPPQDGCEQAGQKRCGGQCVIANPDNGCGNTDCAPCAPVANAVPSCSGDSGSCKIESCNPGYADCDGDTQTYDGRIGGTGCEYFFGQGSEIRSTVQEPLEVPRANINIGDDSRDDWGGIPAYPMSQPCNTNDCADDSLPEIIGLTAVPPRQDLDAYFRVAWNQDSFYLLGDVYDSAREANGLARKEAGDGRCQNGSLCEDALTVFFDGLNNRDSQNGLAFDDPRVFLGLAGQAYRVSGFLESGDVDLKAFQHGAACYRIEAKIAWTMIIGVQANATVAGQFPPAPGQNYGFDVSVNDWDPGVSDPTPQRESQLFWLNPGPGYHRNPSGFGAMTLVEQVSPAPPQ
jgi:cellulose/xylan binding protein with CBM9 domain